MKDTNLTEKEIRLKLDQWAVRVSNGDLMPSTMTQGVLELIDTYTASAVKEAEQKLLYDLDEIDNKPWRVFRQLAKIMPEYADTYTRYESFYSYGGSREVEKLIEKHEVTLQAEKEKL